MIIGWLHKVLMQSDALHLASSYVRVSQLKPLLRVNVYEGSLKHHVIMCVDFCRLRPKDFSTPLLHPNYHTVLLIGLLHGPSTVMVRCRNKACRAW